MNQRQIILGTAGHIDHGKTALVRALTGINTDRLDEEKQRGISIDIGFAHLNLPSARLGIVDVPGHERFVKNMLAGASGIDLAMLVIAADDAVMPQTREHLAILELLQISQGVIALTKIDLVEPDWLDMVESEIRQFVQSTFLSQASIVRTSATTGVGIDEMKNVLDRLCATATDRKIRGRRGQFRMPIDRSFVMQGLGTVVTGTIWSGELSAGDEVQWQPEGKIVRVRGIQSHGQSVENIGPGQRAALNLSGVHHTAIRRGHELTAPGLLHSSRLITVQLKILKDSPRLLKHRARVRLHLATQEVIAAVRLLESTTIEPGETSLAQLVCAQPVTAMNRQPFVVRTESPVRTIGGGIVLQSAARMIRRREVETIRRLHELADDSPPLRVAAATYLYDCNAWSNLELCRDAGVELHEVEVIVSDLESRNEIQKLKAGQQEFKIHKEIVNTLCRRVTSAVGRHHDRSPLEPGVPLAQLLTRLDDLPAELVSAVVECMVCNEELIHENNDIRLPEFKPDLTHAQAQLREQTIKAYQQAGFRPPDLLILAQRTGADENQLRVILDLCVSQGELTRLDGIFYLHRDWVEELYQRVITHLRKTGGSTLSEIKDLLGTSRKYAVPICEYMDRVGVTRRQGDLRVLGAYDGSNVEKNTNETTDAHR